MRCLKMFLWAALFFLVTNAWGQSPIKVSGETEHLKYTIEITDSTLISQYKDSTTLIEERFEIVWLLVFAELMCPPKYREEVDAENHGLVVGKIRSWERILKESPNRGAKEKSLIKARNALGTIYKKLYRRYQSDWIDEKWRGDR